MSLRTVSRAATLSGALMLQGCMTALALADRPDGSVLAEMRQGCERDAGIRWVGPIPEGIDLWLPGRLDEDPGETPNVSGLEPYDSYSGNDDEWLSRGIARALYVNIDPQRDRPGARSGPARGEPKGVYRFELASPSDPRCVARRDALLRNNDPGSPGYVFASDATRRCSVYVYVGPFDGQARSAVFVRFEDVALRSRGLYRDGERLFIDGRVRAGFTDYWAVNPRSAAERRGQWGIEACKVGPRGYVDVLGPEGRAS